MRYYCFKTFRTSYYFPKVTKSTRWLFGVYHPYGSRLVKLYWWLFTHCRFVQWLNRVDSRDFDFPFETIMRHCPTGAVMSFNLGTPGDEQKISMLGYVPSSGEEFFAKYSAKETAKLLSRNEIKTLQMLHGSGLAPTLLSSADSGDAVFFRTTRTVGKACTSFELTDDIVELLCKLSAVDADGCEAGTCFSHGDFCPWNMLEQEDGSINLIDWEMAGVRPLGYDLFMFLIHSPLIMGRNADLVSASLNVNDSKIHRYFSSLGIEDYTQCLLSFLRLRIKEEREKRNQSMVESYNALMANYDQ